MRALRVVGITEDNGVLSVVLEDPAHKEERFIVPADEKLRAAARGDLTRLGQISIELESQLRPREIQARIRAGASVEQVAAAAGVPVAKIERFAYPVLLERSRTAELAQYAHPVRTDGAPDSRTLGEVVAHTFSLRGLEYSGVEWDSWKGEDGRWIVSLSWRAGRSENVAHWTFQPGAHGGTVTAIDEHASDLVEGLPQRQLRTAAVIDMARPGADGPGTGHDEVRVVGRRTADGTDVPGHHAGVPPATRAAEHRHAGPPAPRQADPIESAPPPTTRPATRTASPTPPPAPPPAAPTPPPAPPDAAQPDTEPPAAAETAPSTTPAPPAPEPEPPAAQPEPAPEPPPAAPEKQPPKRTKKGKPVMPSWDEVLLGVRGQR
ncbi:Protein of unknown function [Pseudonocardia thermophila]|jgi:Predicted membrane protein|uniref:DUF3071 domain-containing protein n=1 Tax=Pseudonocardia thermophila TaxID=1848 RepID=A0A1M6YKQ6_PSETH|nr:septation protein SepH [Pseudonocardia thermophila]SHL18645.1 Protein of unknown function [Pseudonocardia thermophila]